MSNQKTLGEIFGEYIKEEKNEEILESLIERFAVYRDDRRADLIINPNILLPKKEVKKFEKQIKNILNLDIIKIHTKYPSDMFDPSYLFEIVQEVKIEGGLVNGFFEGAESFVEEDIFVIKLYHGGKELLTNTGVDRKIQKIIKNEFDLNLKVIFEMMTDDDKKIDSFVEKTVPMEKVDNSKAEKTEVKPKASTIKFDIEGLPIDKESMLVILGKEIKEKPIKISDVNAESGRVVLWGDIFNKDSRDIQDGKKTIYTFDFTDYTSSITMKIFADKSKKDALEALSKGDTIIVRGDADFDKYDSEVIIKAYDIATVKKTQKLDNAPKKRVELHMHTNMSSMDGMNSIGDLVKIMSDWGQTACAVTDHGVVQAFPDAMNAANKVKKSGKNNTSTGGVTICRCNIITVSDFAQHFQHI